MIQVIAGEHHYHYQVANEARLLEHLKWARRRGDSSWPELAGEVFRQLFQDAPTGIYAATAAGEIVLCNPAFARLAGYPSADEAVSASLLHHLARPQDWDELLRTLREQGCSDLLEVELLRRDGQRVTLLHSAVGAFDRRGQLTQVRGYLLALPAAPAGPGSPTERARAVAAMVESLPDAALAVDLQGRVLAWNQAMEELTGVPAAVVVGKGGHEHGLHLLGARRPTVADAVLHPTQPVAGLECLSRHGQSAAAEMSVVLRGQRRRLWARAGVLRDHAGEVVGAVEIIRDLGELGEPAVRPASGQEQAPARLPEGYFEMDIGGNLTACDRTLADMLGMTPEEARGLNYRRYTDRENAHRFYQALHRAFRGEEAVRDMAWEIVGRQGQRYGVEVSLSLLRDGEGQPCGFRGMVRDVTERRQAESALRDSEARLRRITDNMLDIVSQIDIRGQLQYVSPSFTSVLGYDAAAVLGTSFFDLLHPADLAGVRTAIDEGRETGVVERLEFRIRHADGRFMWVETVTKPLPDEEGQMAGFILAIRDITERRQAEEQLRYLSLHDSLTGLYNRAYFEEEMRRLEKGRFAPIGVIVGDVDGLKLVNDTLGHGAGDNLLVAAANCIKECFRESDVVARVGGDEFAVLLPNSDQQAVESARQRIRDAVARYNEANPRLPLSISVGMAVSGEGPINLDLVFKEADNNMYREKLHRSQSIRSTIVQTLMKTLEARDLVYDGHVDRLQELVTALGMAAGLSERRLDDLRLLAKFHDIGKVGVPDRILFKPGPLTPEETLEMQRHCEIGHRIAVASPDLAPIADWILKQHEWWNGEGYPLGLAGQDIPLECRILAIADAYDAMTSDRPYRKAMTHEQALAELRRCAGTQFDPRLVAAFMQVVSDGRERQRDQGMEDDETRLMRAEIEQLIEKNPRDAARLIRAWMARDGR